MYRCICESKIVCVVMGVVFEGLWLWLIEISEIGIAHTDTVLFTYEE